MGLDSVGEQQRAQPLAVPRAGYFRWVICALLLFGVTKNYMDRQVLGVLKTTLQQEFGWNEIQYGHLVFYFQAAYAAGMVLVGRLIDRLGTRLGYTLAMVFWRSGRFPGEHKMRGGMVSQERACAGDGDLQRRNKRRSDCYAAGGAMDCAALGLARSVSDYRG